MLKNEQRRRNKHCNTFPSSDFQGSTEDLPFEIDFEKEKQIKGTRLCCSQFKSKMSGHIAPLLF